MKRLILSFALIVGACGESVDPAALPSLDDFEMWDSFDVEGSAPGHGDTFRTIYANAEARSYTGAGRYQERSVLIKEIRDRGNGRDGALQYVAIMRKVDPDDPAFDGVPSSGGWVFTSADEVGADETSLDFCWDSCHVQAPIDGAFYNYGGK